MVDGCRFQPLIFQGDNDDPPTPVANLWRSNRVSMNWPAVCRTERLPIPPGCCVVSRCVLGIICWGPNATSRVECTITQSQASHSTTRQENEKHPKYLAILNVTFVG